MTAVQHDAPTVSDTSVDRADDIVAIHAIIGRVEAGYNTNDAELMIGDFIDNAVVVNAMGALLTGRTALLESSRAGLAGFLRDEYVTYEPLAVTFLRPDIAFAHKYARATEADGTLIDQEPAMIALYVLVKENGRWWAAARQNTQIPRSA